MNNTYEIDVFLKNLGSIYEQNPQLEISQDTIYIQLRTFNLTDNKLNIVPQINLEQQRINIDNKFEYKANCFFANRGYFWVFENRNNFNDEEFYNKIDNAIKMYISIDEISLEYVSEKIFNFMLQNNILTQSKISRDLRTDALVLRVEKLEDAKKISQFVNSLNYETKYKVNPFLFKEGKVGIAKDGGLSYNSTISKILEEYFKNRRNRNKLNEVGYEDFNKFINLEFEYKSPKFIQSLNLKELKEYNDYLIIYDILKNNINKTSTIDMFENYDRNKTFSHSKNITNSYKGKQINDIINSMYQKYSLNEIYMIFTKYIETGNLRLFTRDNNIRYIVEENFNQKTFKEELDNYVWNTFLNAYKQTYSKYNEKQAYGALDKFIKTNSFESFTNDNNARHYLSNYINRKYLRKVILNKVLENGFNYSVENINQIILNELNIEPNINMKKSQI